MAPKHRLYTLEVAETILERLADGEPLKVICRSPDMPSAGAVHWWVITDHDGFAVRYARAREAGLAMMAEDALEIADDGSNDTYLDGEGNRRTDQDVVQRSRLRVDTRKWLLSKLLPKVFGDRIDVNHGVQPLSEVPESGLDERLTKLLAPKPEIVLPPLIEGSAEPADEPETPK